MTKENDGAGDNIRIGRRMIEAALKMEDNLAELLSVQITACRQRSKSRNIKCQHLAQEYYIFLDAHRRKNCQRPGIMRNQDKYQLQQAQLAGHP